VKKHGLISCSGAGRSEAGAVAEFGEPRISDQEIFMELHPFHTLAVWAFCIVVLFGDPVRCLSQKTEASPQMVSDFATPPQAARLQVRFWVTLVAASLGAFCLPFGNCGFGPNGRPLSEYRLRNACEDSQSRLQTDHIDHCQRHHVERRTRWEDIWLAIEGLV
jgi:hypothetical protein